MGRFNPETSALKTLLNAKVRHLTGTGLACKNLKHLK